MGMGMNMCSCHFWIGVSRFMMRMSWRSWFCAGPVDAGVALAVCHHPWQLYERSLAAFERYRVLELEVYCLQHCCKWGAAFDFVVVVQQCPSRSYVVLLRAVLRIPSGALASLCTRANR